MLSSISFNKSKAFAVFTVLALIACGHPSAQGDSRPADPAPLTPAKPLEPTFKVQPPPADAVERAPASPPASPAPPATPSAATPSTPAGPAQPPPPPAAAVPVVKTLSVGFKKCVLCHGQAGRGGTSGINGPDLTTFAGDFAAFSKIVRSGKGSMPPIKVSKYADADMANDFTVFTGKAAP